MNPIAFFLALPFSTFDEITEKLQKYIEPQSHYLVVGEKSENTHKTTNGEHFHFLVDFTEKSYKNFTKHFIEKYKLRGSAREGIARQYGKIKKINDLEKLHQYMCKDICTENPIYTNYENDEIDAWAKKSFKKQSKKNYLDSMSEKLTKAIKHTTPSEVDTLGISLEVVRCHLFHIHLEDQMNFNPDNRKAITKSQLQSLANYWVQFHGIKRNDGYHKQSHPWVDMEPIDKYNFLFTFNY